MVIRANPALGTILRTSFGAAMYKGLQIYYPLDEASGTRRDLGPNGLTLTDNNTVTGNPGPSNRILLASQFTALSLEYLSVASSAPLQAGTDFTICGWVYLDSLAVDQYILWKAGAITSDTEYGVRYVAGAGLRFSYTDGTTASSVTATTFGNLTVSTWYFWVISFDIANNTARISINAGPRDTVVGTTNGVLVGTHQLEIGARVDTVQFMGGRQAGVGKWNRLWTPSETNFMYNGGQGRELIGNRFI